MMAGVGEIRYSFFPEKLFEKKEQEVGTNFLKRILLGIKNDSPLQIEESNWRKTKETKKLTYEQINEQLKSKAFTEFEVFTFLDYVDEKKEINLPFLKIPFTTGLMKITSEPQKRKNNYIVSATSINPIFRVYDCVKKINL